MRARAREGGRGERVLPGLWRLRMPLPWPGVPHGNAWAIAAGDGIVLVDTSIHSEDSMGHLERALDQVGLQLEQVNLLVITHAHTDHCGQAGPIVARAGCEMWMHPNHTAAYRQFASPGDDLAQRLEIARQSGVNATVLAEYEERVRGAPSLVKDLREPDRPLLDGVIIETDLGRWEVVETPGHAPSHVCLYQAEHRLLISGDHLLGRISLFFDYGVSPDPVAQFMRSLDRVATLQARLALSGHGRPFLDVPGHIAGTRRVVDERTRTTREAMSDRPRTATEIGREVHGPVALQQPPAWWLPQTLCFLEHLELRGEAQREQDGELELWTLAC